jgi:hypothetical protein
VTLEETVERYADARPGYVLASYAEVGLPFYRIRLRLQTLERKDLGPLEEFALRAVAADITDSAAVGAALGLEGAVLDAAVVELAEREALLIGATNPSSGGSRLTLTERGKDILTNAQVIVPRERIVDIEYDGLLREPAPFLTGYLEPRELKSAGIREVPPHPAKRPDLDELRDQIDRIEDLIRQLGGGREQVNEVLAVRSIERRLRVFQHAIALVYRAETGRSTQVAFAIDGHLSDRHERVFAESGLGRKFGIAQRGLEPARKLAARVLGEDVVARIDERHISELRHRAALADPTGSQPVPSTAEEEADAARTEFNALPVRPVETYEHPRLLTEALTSTKQRLLLVSPWLKRAVVDKEFVERLDQVLQRGAAVYLGWGMSASETESPDADPDALADLERLATRHTNFHLKRLGRTHAKVLLCDRRYVVVTSFNWLSFRGDPKRTFRDERGTLVAMPEYVDGQFEEWRARFE